MSKDSVVTSCNPDFIVSGFQKCATTFLWKTLGNHPQISMPSKKELNFFSNREMWTKGVDWYRSHFKDDKNIWGDVSPNYSGGHYKTIINRMKDVVPNVKFIVSIRNPIDRAFSAYNHYMQNLETSRHHGGWLLPGKSFENNINAELGSNLKGQLTGVGIYVSRLEYLTKHYPRESILVVVQEHMNGNPEETYNKIYDFLGVDRVHGEYENIHKRVYENSMNDGIYLKLKEFYRPHNQRLFEFLGHEIEEWAER